MNTDVSSFFKLKLITDKIDGWCQQEAMATWHSLLTFQKSKLITGNFLDIGVWRGKSAAIMLDQLKANEKLYLVDHEIQDKLKMNLSLINSDHKNIIYHESPSWGLEHTNFPSDSFRWIHIDCKHSGESVYNNLKAADKFLSFNGVVSVDDFFLDMYPQITQAVYRYLDRNPYSFGIFLQGFNKAYLARIEYIDTYLQYCKQNLLTDLEERNTPITLYKTTYSADLNCFSMQLREEGQLMRGPDWEECKQSNAQEIEIS
jgi:predicted O-methyltransferase YrrM